MKELYKEIVKKISPDRIKLNEPMCKHTSFKIGGPADMFVILNNIEELKYLLKTAKENKINLTCVGNGTNLLVKDRGIRGITFKLNFKEIKIENEIITVGSGALIPTVAKAAYESELSGLEFASGIPGTIGGAIKMNAGAYGGEFKDIVLETTFMDEDCNLHTITNDEHKFSYRNSLFSSNNNIIVLTKLKLHKNNKEKIKAKMDENLAKRKEKQPINMPNAGSIFKRKNNIIPAEVIDKCGLKGYNINDAVVSNLHSGFIVNKGNATAADVLELIDYIKNTIKQKYNEDLEIEIKVIGE